MNVRLTVNGSGTLWHVPRYGERRYAVYGSISYCLVCIH